MRDGTKSKQDCYIAISVMGHIFWHRSDLVEVEKPRTTRSLLEPGTCVEVERQYTKHQILLDAMIHRNLFSGIRKVFSQILSNSQRSMCQFYRLSNETSKNSYRNPKSSEYIDKLWLLPRMNHDLTFYVVLGRTALKIPHIIARLELFLGSEELWKHKRRGGWRTQKRKNIFPAVPVLHRTL